METITLTKQEYHRKMFEAYKEGFKSAIETLQGAFVAVEEAAEQKMHPTLGESAASDSESKLAPKRVI